MNKKPKPDETIIFFDIDDTLYDSSGFRVIARKESIKVLNKSLRKFSHNFSDDYLYEQFEKIYQEDKNSSRMYDRLLEELKIPINEISMHVAKTVKRWEDTKNKMRTFKGVKSILKKLKEKGYTLGIASSGLGIKQWDKLLRIGIMDYFDPKNVFMTDEINGYRRKYTKDKLFYLQIKSYYENTNFKNFYIVGDKLTQDILPASKADFKTIYFQPFNQKHSEKIDDKNIKVITDFKQLLDIF